MDQEAFDLHRLLVAAGERGPYVVVASQSEAWSFVFSLSNILRMSWNSSGRRI